jgi:hypothetical protein
MLELIGYLLVLAGLGFAILAPLLVHLTLRRLL